MFRPLILPVQAPTRTNLSSSQNKEGGNTINSATSLQGFMPTWKKIKGSQTLQAFYDSNPAVWKEGGVIYSWVLAPLIHLPALRRADLTRPARSTAACFDRNMWIASDIAHDYQIATEKNNTPPAQKKERIVSAVGKINFLLDRGLGQDRSLPASDIRLVPAPLRESRLRDMKSALVGSYYHLSAKSTSGKERAFDLYKAHTSSHEPNALVSPAWSTSRKTEALHEASAALKSQYETSDAPYRMGSGSHPDH